ncbi:MAG: hypothetical protein KDE33_24615, partial [Bacteroidetes bacterium]|nr:hypothetical protein [Bacteroidota bacterium]
YTKRPISWQSYVDSLIKRRLLLIDVMSKMTNAFNQYHNQKHLKPLAEYVHDYTENYHKKIKGKFIHQLPKSIIDEWGDFSEGDAKKVKSNFDDPEILHENKEQKQLLASKRYSTFIGLYRNYDSSIENFLWQSAETIFRKLKRYLNEDVSALSDNARISLVGNLFKAFEGVDKFQEEFRVYFEKFVDPIVLKRVERMEVDNISILCFLYRQFIYSDSFIKGKANKVAIERLKSTESNIRKKIFNSLKRASKEFRVKIKIEFNDTAHQCIILIDNNNAIEHFQILELVYNKLYEAIEQPDYTSIKYLILNTKYPVFNIVLLVHGKTINSTWYEFKTYNLREKRIHELEQFNLIPQKIPLDVIDKYSINSWNNELIEFEDLDKLLESSSTAYQLAFHFSQLKYFEGKDIEDYNDSLLRAHVNKVGSLFQDNLQVAITLLNKYIEKCNNGEIEFSDNEEKKEFYELLFNSHKLFYLNDLLAEKGEMKFTLGIEQIEEWIPRLEQLVNNISVIYYFLGGKVIEKEVDS